jgi:hypothetical protein
MGRVEVQGQTWQKVNETPSQQNKVGMVVYACGPSYLGGVGRRIGLRPAQATALEPL